MRVGKIASLLPVPDMPAFSATQSVHGEGWAMAEIEAREVDRQVTAGPWGRYG
jgi:hypothetical protein